MPRLYSYSLAAGLNNAAGLVNIQTITPSGDQVFYPPEAYSTFSPGTLRIRLDGQAYTTGFSAFTWRWKLLTRAQWRYLQDTYTTGGNSYSGKVTVRTRNIDGSYTNYNAILLLPPMPELQRNFTVYENVEIRFTRLATPS